MKTIVLHDKEFELYIPYEKIKSVVEVMAEEMNRDLKGKNPLFVCILNGSFMFAAELFKRITLVDAEITFIKLTSYSGFRSTGQVRQLIGLDEDLTGRTVVVLEDIVDSGLTIANTLGQLETQGPAEIKIATLLLKPDALLEKVPLHYVGLEIPDEFIVGYGLDYNGRGRNLIDIYKVISNNSSE